MHDPVGSYLSIKENFITYVKTAFGTKYPSLEKQREDILNRNGVLAQEPWVEIMPRYEEGAALRDLSLESLGKPQKFTQEDLNNFQDFANCGLIGQFALHKHQVEMLKRGLAGENLVVTAGTGSGKTESFLMPIFAQLVQESKSWKTPDTPSEAQKDWWENSDHLGQFANGRLPKETKRVSQRGHESRPAAVRALILYPMNALVEDQLTRLRKALDSPQATEWYRNNLGENRFYFGRYTGTTPVAGNEFKENGRRESDRVKRLIKELREADATQSEARKYDQINHNGERAVSYFFPSLDGSEMRCRWDMQETPPDILISNFSMLSIMLMRKVDEQIFQQTRDWLANNDAAVFNLVLDELHLYRGTAGTETAYLIRLLLERLGLTPDSPKLRILCSSASLDSDDPKSIKFLSDFFGVNGPNAVQIVPGSLKNFERHDEYLPWMPFVNLASVWESRAENGKVLKDAYDGIAQSFGAPENEDGIEAILRIFNKENSLMSRAISSAFWREESTSPVTCSLSEFGESLFGKDLKQEDRDAATRGLLICRALIEFEVDGGGNKRAPRDYMPSLRFHWFFKNLEGLWATIETTDNEHGFKPEEGENRPVGNIFPSPRIITDKRNCVLELLYCEQCGAILLGGEKYEHPDGGWELLPVDPKIENAPDRPVTPLSQEKKWQEYGIFWPNVGMPCAHVASWNTPVDKGGGTCTWIPANINHSSGFVMQGHVQEGTKGFSNGFFFLVEGTESHDAFPAICPSCDEDYRRRLKNSPIRTFRTGFTKVSQTMAKEMFYQLPETGRNRKLVIFSDSREDAARLSNDMERYHYSEIVRDTVFNRLAQDTFGKAEALSCRQKDIPFTDLAQKYVDEYPAKQEELEEIADALKTTEEEMSSMKPFLANHVVDLQNTGKQILEALQSSRVRLGDYVTFESPVIVKDLKRLGMNPAGADLRVQSFEADGQDCEWFNLLDMDNDAEAWRTLSDEERTVIQNELIPRVRQEVASSLFGNLYFGFESSGLGYPAINFREGQQNEILTSTL